MFRYVKRNFAGQSDGSRANPWTTIQAALDDVPPGGTVLVAAGVYSEDLVLDKPGVRLLGACPDQVMVRGTDERIPPGEENPCGRLPFKPALCVTGSDSAPAGGLGGAPRGCRVASSARRRSDV
jgi:hypothetical protein